MYRQSLDMPELEQLVRRIAEKCARRHRVPLLLPRFDATTGGFVANLTIAASQQFLECQEAAQLVSTDFQKLVADIKAITPSGVRVAGSVVWCAGGFFVNPVAGAMLAAELATTVANYEYGGRLQKTVNDLATGVQTAAGTARTEAHSLIALIQRFIDQAQETVVSQAQERACAALPTSWHSTLATIQQLAGPDSQWSLLYPLIEEIIDVTRVCTNTQVFAEIKKLLVLVHSNLDVDHEVAKSLQQALDGLETMFSDRAREVFQQEVGRAHAAYRIMTSAADFIDIVAPAHARLCQSLDRTCNVDSKREQINQRWLTQFVPESVDCNNLDECLTQSTTTALQRVQQVSDAWIEGFVDRATTYATISRKHVDEVATVLNKGRSPAARRTRQHLRDIIKSTNHRSSNPVIGSSRARILLLFEGELLHALEASPLTVKHFTEDLSELQEYECHPYYSFHDPQFCEKLKLLHEVAQVELPAVVDELVALAEQVQSAKDRVAAHWSGFDEVYRRIKRVIDVMQAHFPEHRGLDGLIDIIKSLSADRQRYDGLLKTFEPISDDSCDGSCRPGFLRNELTAHVSLITAYNRPSLKEESTEPDGADVTFVTNCTSLICVLVLVTSIGLFMSLVLLLQRMHNTTVRRLQRMHDATVDNFERQVNVDTNASVALQQQILALQQQILASHQQLETCGNTILPVNPDDAAIHNYFERQATVDRNASVASPQCGNVVQYFKRRALADAKQISALYGYISALKEQIAALEQHINPRPADDSNPIASA